MQFVHHRYERGWPFLHFMWWGWRGVIVLLGNHQFDVFWGRRWSRGEED